MKARTSPPNATEPGSDRHGPKDLEMHLVRIPSGVLRVAFIATLFGGILVSLAGVALVGFSSAVVLPAPSSGSVNGLGAIGILLGLTIILVGLNFRGARRGLHAYGVIAIVLGLASLPFGAGFWVGLALTVAGGLVALAVPGGPEWKLVPTDVDGCPECGYMVSKGWNRCPECGTSLDPVKAG